MKLFLNHFKWYRKLRGGIWSLCQYVEEYTYPFSGNNTNSILIWRKGEETVGGIDRIGKWVLYKSIDSEDWTKKI